MRFIFILNLMLIRKKPDLQTNLSLLLNQLKFLKLLKVRMIHQKKVFGLLPKTGVANSLLLTSYGFVLFLIIICLKKRRKKEEEVK